MLRDRLSSWPISREVAWFADVPYSRAAYPAQVTVLRQHRIEPPLSFILHDEFFTTLVLDLRCGLSDLEARFSKTTRYEIARAMRQGFMVTTSYGDHLAAFTERHRRFNAAKHLGPPLRSKDLARLSGHVSLYSVSNGPQWLADLMVIGDERRVRQWVTISDIWTASRAHTGYATRLAVWKSIADAKARGVETYDFGGIVRDREDPRHGITAFKSSFGGTEITERNTIVIHSTLIRRCYELRRRLARMQSSPKAQLRR